MAKKKRSTKKSTSKVGNRDASGSPSCSSLCIAAAIVGLETALHRFEHNCGTVEPCRENEMCEIHKLAIKEVEQVLAMLEFESGIDFETAEIMPGVIEQLRA